MKGEWKMKMEELNGQSCSVATTPLPADPVVAMAYVPYQQYNDVYTPEKGLDRGTIFPDLDKPFYGRRGAPR